MGATAQVKIGLSLRLTPDVTPDLSIPYNLLSIPLPGDSNWEFGPNGTGIGQINLGWHDQVIANVAITTINLQTLANNMKGDGSTISFSELRFAYFRNRSATDAVTIAGNTAGPAPPPWGKGAATCPISLPPSADSNDHATAVLLITGQPAGWPVVAGNRIVTFQASVGTANVDVVFGGLGS